MKRLLTPLLAALFLWGCTAPQPQAPAEDKTPAAKNLSPLVEAKDHEDLECDSVNPLVAEIPLSAMPFYCSRLNVTATLDEMKDTGWRLMSLDIGKQYTLNGVAAMPLHITMRKLF